MKHLMPLIHGGEGRNRGIYRSREREVRGHIQKNNNQTNIQNDVVYIKYEYRSKLVLKKKTVLYFYLNFEMLNVWN